MKKTILIMLFIFSSFVFAKDEVLGLWITEKGDSGNQIIVEVYKTMDNKYNGKIKALTMPVYIDGEFVGQEKMDLKNKDKSLQNRKLIGIDFVFNFNYNEKENKYENGNIYNPENGKIYYSNMRINATGKLEVKGSIDKSGLIGKKQIWTRYNQ